MVRNNKGIKRVGTRRGENSSREKEGKGGKGGGKGKVKVLNGGINENDSS